MDVALTVPELVTLTLPDGLPPGVGTPTLAGAEPGSGPSAPGDVIVVDIDAREIPALPTAARLAALAAGIVTVRVRVVEVVAGRARLDVTATARGLPAHRLIGIVRGPVEDALRARLTDHGVPADAVRLGHDGDRLEVVADTAALLAAAPLPPHLRGLRVSGLRLADGAVHITLALP